MRSLTQFGPQITQVELTVDEALQQGVAAHKAGKLQDAERLYRAILQAQPEHPDANHNLGLLAVAMGRPLEAIPFFNTALDASPQIEQLWLSYIDVLITVDRFDEAKRVLAEGEKSGVSSEKLDAFKQRLEERDLQEKPKVTKGQTLSEKRRKAAEKKKHKKKIAQGSSSSGEPSQDQINRFVEHFQAGRLEEAKPLAMSLTQQFPKHPFGWKALGAVLLKMGRLGESLAPMQSAVELSPQDAEAYSNLGNALKELGKFNESEASLRQAIALKPDYAEAHSNLGVTLQELGRLDDAEASCRKAIALKPDYAEAHSNLGVTLQELGRLDEAEASLRQAIAVKPDSAEAHNNLGITLKALGRSDDAEASYRQATALKPDYAEAHSNLGVTLQELGRLDDAEVSLRQAIAVKPDYADAYWNLHGLQKTIESAEHWIDKCLEVDENHAKARLTKAALRFYRGDKRGFTNLMQSELKQHPYMRSFAWTFSLPKLPELHFDKWHFFDAIVKKSITSKPFYEFGVWRASSFRYLIKVFKKGYGFDTFTGLPEEWNVGSRIEKKGTYTSDGNVPKIKGGEFIVGKFEDTLPVFFSQSRPTASVINFDADLYSSTICALNFSKSVMDKNTILIFDELIINESWEQDEFKALNEFCSINHYSYEVLAVSFCTKQVAVKLIGI